MTKLTRTAIFLSVVCQSLLATSPVSGREPKHTLKTGATFVGRVAFSPDGKTLAAGHDWDIKLWDVTTGQELVKLQGHAGELWTVAFSPDGKTVARRAPTGRSSCGTSPRAKTKPRSRGMPAR